MFVWPLFCERSKKHLKLSAQKWTHCLTQTSVGGWRHCSRSLPSLGTEQSSFANDLFKRTNLGGRTESNHLLKLAVHFSVSSVELSVSCKRPCRDTLTLSLCQIVPLRGNGVPYVCSVVRSLDVHSWTWALSDRLLFSHSSPSIFSPLPFMSCSLGRSTKYLI